MLFSQTLRGLGSPEALRDQPAALSRPGVNAHIHLPPNFSAFETVAQAVSLAAAQDIAVLGASNYYDYNVYADFADLAQQKNIFPLFGLEIICLIDSLKETGVKINDPGNPGKMYLCGKGMMGFDPISQQAASLLQTIRDNDSERIVAVTEALAMVFADVGLSTDLTADAVKHRVARHGTPLSTVYLQERHVAQAFQEVLFEQIPEADRPAVLLRLFGTAATSPTDAVAVQNEIRSHLLKSGKPAYVPETFVGFDHAYQLILALGGIPSYPVLADGVSPLTDYEQSPEALVADLHSRGIPAAEFIPNRNTPEVLSRYVHALRDAGLFVTAGTEHNTLDLLPIAPTCLGGVPIPEAIQEIFWEGACIIAAHQYLTAQGKPGYTAQSRPEDFCGLGVIVLASYRMQNLTQQTRVVA